MARMTGWMDGVWIWVTCMGLIEFVSSSVVFRCTVLGYGLPVAALRPACFLWSARIAMIPIALLIRLTNGSPWDQSHYRLQMPSLMLPALSVSCLPTSMPPNQSELSRNTCSRDGLTRKASLAVASVISTLEEEIVRE